MAAHSYSRLHAYATCPSILQFMRDRIRGETSDPLMLGGFAHEFFARYTRHCQTDALGTDLSQVRRIAEQTLDAYQVDARGHGNLPLTHAQYAAAYADLCVPFAKSRLFDWSRIVGIEVLLAMTQEFELCVWLDDSVWFRAVLDLLEIEDDHAEITDYKTGWDTDADRLQMRCYAWLVFRLYPQIRTITCCFDYIRFNVQKNVEFDYDTHFEGLEADVLSLIERVEGDDEMQPTPGPHCLACNYWRHCTAAVVPIDALQTISDAHKAVENIALLDRDMVRQKAMLRLWVDQHGPVEHNGVIWANHPDGGYGFDDPEAFCGAVVDDPRVKRAWDFLNVDNTRARKKLANESGEFDGALGEVAVNKRRVRFGAKKAKGDGTQK